MRPTLSPAAQGGAAGLVLGGAQAAPRCPFPQELAQGGQHAHSLGRRMARPGLTPTLAALHHRRNQSQDPEIQRRPPSPEKPEMGSTAACERVKSVQPKVDVETAS